MRQQPRVSGKSGDHSIRIHGARTDDLHRVGVVLQEICRDTLDSDLPVLTVGQGYQHGLLRHARDDDRPALADHVDSRVEGRLLTCSRTTRSRKPRPPSHPTSSIPAPRRLRARRRPKTPAPNSRASRRSESGTSVTTTLRAARYFTVASTRSPIVPLGTFATVLPTMSPARRTACTGGASGQIGAACRSHATGDPVKPTRRARLTTPACRPPGCRTRRMQVCRTAPSRGSA
jgi:hypothetical protein